MEIVTRRLTQISPAWDYALSVVLKTTPNIRCYTLDHAAGHQIPENVQVYVFTKHDLSADPLYEMISVNPNLDLPDNDDHEVDAVQFMLSLVVYDKLQPTARRLLCAMYTYDLALIKVVPETLDELVSLGNGELAELLYYSFNIKRPESTLMFEYTLEQIRDAVHRVVK